MDGQLIEVCGPEHSSTEWVTLLEDLRHDVAALRNRVDHLERENLQLRQQAGYWQSRHRDALRRIGGLEQQVEHLQGEKRQLQADLFGRPSETTALKDRSNGYGSFVCCTNSTTAGWRQRMARRRLGRRTVACVRPWPR